MKRREFITAAGAGSAATAAGVTGAVGTAAAQEAEEEPVWPEFVQEASNYSSGETQDARGQGEVTVQVGAGDGLQFAPPALWIDPGTTVIWEWTGEGGSHNVSAQDGADFTSEVVSEAGFTFEHTFEGDGQIVTYQCDPHASQGMHGGVAVGGVETQEVQSGVITDPEELGIKVQEHYVGIGAVLMISVSLVFTFFVLKYGESPHAKGGN
ncbi:halocyanin domain-containing protein [Halalkalicoccus jeotgali]|uniref:Halocyanin n=1 Tax=Halalkalicoccus jeotgali (strain DSM 18796 / CECT 7217 / JCM 14584 / KCTC 4019 / B3) TaxID=795797 RepID=D8J4Z1_HALJB|nr:halocyanin domain-containing protein [Halalkalicoccus jeotgali]ADJ15608.1 halocyanin [Halalkalicoccus jeotgali B3]ELY36314.1 halocyanin [Halalkalicoccus jeotgali B3]